MTSTPEGSRTTAADVLAVLDVADQVGARLWLDGGWGVDALLGEQTREHDDLDFAVTSDRLPAFEAALGARGFRRLGEEGAQPWNFLMGDDGGVVLDFHVITLTESGDGAYGPAERGVFFPAASLRGHGTILGRAVETISPAWIGDFHDRYTGDADDRADVRALCARFGLEVPAQYR